MVLKYKTLPISSVGYMTNSNNNNNSNVTDVLDLVHIFWLLPQYIVLTVGEILFSITSLEFAYSQVRFISFSQVIHCLYLSACLSFTLFVSHYLSPLFLTLSLALCVGVYLFVCLSRPFRCLCPCNFICIHLSLSLSVCLCLCEIVEYLA